MLKLGCCFPQSSLKFWLRAWLTAGIYQKLLWFVSIYVVIISSSVFYLSKLTKFELIITIFEHNCVYLSSQN